MKLILIRHAEAHAVGDHGIETDFDRSLTEHGRQQTEALAKHLAKLALPIDRILTSPYVRAMQTAGLLADALTPNTVPAINDLLGLEELKPKRFAKSIESNEFTLLVGHQPDLGRFAGWLLGCGRETIAFEKGSAALIECGKQIRKGGGVLQWFLSPTWVTGILPAE